MFKKSIFWFSILWVVIVVSFIVSALWVVSYASGYRIDFQDLKLQKTGLIVVGSEPRDAQVLLDGRLKTKKTPVKFNFLLPRTYQVAVVKDGYYSWGKTVLLEAGQAKIFDRIILFSQNPKIEEVNNGLTPGAQNIFQIESQVRNLPLPQTDGSEIWLGTKDKLVSRFFKPVLNVAWFPDQQHILFQLSDEIHAVEIDGGNDTTLVKLGTSEPTEFTTQESGHYLIYKDGSALKRAKIR